MTFKISSFVLGHVLTMGFLPLLFLTNGCRTATPLPPANLSQSGWNIQQGQAVWHTEGGREIAGDFLVAIRDQGRSVIQFTKSPFTLVLAQTVDGRWQVEFPPEQKRYSGRGEPPARLIWFNLPRALVNRPLPKDFKWHEDSQGWRLENAASGEFLQGYFSR
jgi:hypothetical protein